MIINLTQHVATPAQVDAGVVDLSESQRAELSALLTIDEDVLRASKEAREGLYNARVSGIISLIWPILVREDQARVEEAARLYAGGDQLGGWNAARRPLFDAMVGGAPYLVDRLAARLKELDVRPVYATTARRSAETVLPDGSVRKTQVFDHIGFEDA